MAVKTVKPSMSEAYTKDNMTISHIAIDLKEISYYTDNDTLFLSFPAEEVTLSGTKADLDAMGFNPVETDELLDEFAFNVRKLQAMKILKTRIR